jgi:hypothetical protein
MGNEGEDDDTTKISYIIKNASINHEDNRSDI